MMHSASLFWRAFSPLFVVGVKLGAYSGVICKNTMGARWFLLMNLNSTYNLEQSSGLKHFVSPLESVWNKIIRIFVQLAFRLLGKRLIFMSIRKMAQKSNFWLNYAKNNYTMIFYRKKWFRCNLIKNEIVVHPPYSTDRQYWYYGAQLDVILHKNYA